MKTIDCLLDTNFLIIRWRQGRQSSASIWLRSNADRVVRIPWIVKAEFLRGAVVVGHDKAEVQSFLGRYPTVWPDDTLLEMYAVLFADLKKRNAMIGPHDLWIAATAVAHDLPLVTRNINEFEKVPGLKLEEF